MTAWGAAILGCAGTELSGDERAFFAQSNPFGFILFARNIETANQLRRLTADLREAVGWNAPVFIDQEGGRVQRLRACMWVCHVWVCGCVGCGCHASVCGWCRCVVCERASE